MTTIAPLSSRDDLPAALAAHRAGSAAEAERLYREALATEPDNADALHLLGVLVGKPGRAGGFEEALPLLTQAVELDPTAPNFRLNLGSLLGRMGRTAEAVEQFREALRLRSGYPEAAENLGVALGKLGRWAESAEACRRAVALRPDSASAHHRQGDALRRVGRPADAAEAHRRAIALAPDRPEALSGLAADCGELGMIAEVIECHRKVAELLPESASAGSDYLHVLHYDPGVSRERLLEEARRWGRKHAGGTGVSPVAFPLVREEHCRDDCATCAADGEARAEVQGPLPVPLLECRGRETELEASDAPAARPSGTAAKRDGKLPLRIGFVSPDFHEHPVARLSEPILEHLDRTKFQTFCYSDTGTDDRMTRRIKAAAGNWRETGGLSNEAVAELIRRDGIDILVDLAGHMGGNRLPMYALRPAPVQVTHFNYPDTTGVPEMDWRITDDLAEPAGGDDPHDRYSTERLCRLPRRGWCYRPTLEAPDVGPLPALDNGYVTFAALNKPVKHSPPCVALWARVLEAAPTTKLMLLGFEDAAQNEPIAAQFGAHGIGPERLRFVTRRPRLKYLELYNQADAALDPFPYNGGVTSCDSLWMGVPFVTLEGNSYLSRQGLMLLTNIGMPRLVARTERDYVGLACAMARNLPKLAAVRAGLRERFGRSPMADGAGFARDVGEAFLRMWPERGEARPRADQGHETG